MEHYLTTANPELMALWFLEVIQKLDTGHSAWNQIFIEPDYITVDGKSEPDWPIGNLNWEVVPNGLTPVDRGRWFVEKMKWYLDREEELQKEKALRNNIPRA